MTEARSTLAAAIARRNEAKSSADAAGAALNHATTALETAQGDLSAMIAGEKDRSATYAADLIQAYRSGPAPNVAPPTGADSAARRELEAHIASHDEVLKTLGATHASALSALQAADKALTKAAREVACEGASQVAAEVEENYRHIEMLMRRLRSFEDIAAPREPTGYSNQTIHRTPADVSFALAVLSGNRIPNSTKPPLIYDMRSSMATGRTVYIASSGEDVWQTEEDAWKRHLADLTSDAEAKYAPPTHAAT